MADLRQGFRYRVRNKKTGEIVYQTSDKADAYGHGHGLNPDVEVLDTRWWWGRETTAAEHARDVMQQTNEHFRGHRDLEFGEVVAMARRLAESVLADTEPEPNTDTNINPT